MFRIKEIMYEKRVTNTMMAQKLGVTPQYISTVINGKKNISIAKLKKMSEVLDVPIIALFEGYSPLNQVTSNNEVVCPSCGHILKLMKVK